jgi:hypothetical protein
MGNEPPTNGLHVVSNGIHAPSSFKRSSPRNANTTTEDLRPWRDSERTYQTHGRDVPRMGEMVCNRSREIQEAARQSASVRNEHSFMQQVLPSMLADPSLRFSKRRATGNARDDGRYTTITKRRSNGNKGWRLALRMLSIALFVIGLSVFLTALALYYIQVEVLTR